MSFGNLSSESGLATLNTHLTSRSYIQGYSAGQNDVETFNLVSNNVDAGKFPHVARWYNHIASFTVQQRRSLRPAQAVEVKEEKKAVAPASSSAKKAKVPEPEPEEEEAPAEDLDFDSLGETSASDEAELAAIVKKKEEEAAKAKADAKPAKKAGPAARSNVILDVKPEDDETDMKTMEAGVRAIAMEGLLWGGSQLEAIAFGLKKLRIVAIVHDDIVSVDDLQEAIEKLPGVQSTDIHAFNKV